MTGDRERGYAFDPPPEGTPAPTAPAAMAGPPAEPMSALERNAWSCAYLLIDELEEAAKRWGVMAAEFERDPQYGIGPQNRARLATLFRDAQSHLNRVAHALRPKNVERPT